MPDQSESDSFLRASSMLMGWVYFILWSISFYPQVLKNFKQKSTQGLSPDFPIANTLGLACYTIYASALLYSPVIQAQYADRHHGHKPAVQQNDFVYGAHAVCIEIIVLSQFLPRLWRFNEDAWQKPSLAMLATCSACLAYLLGNVFWVSMGDSPASPQQHGRAWLDAVYAFGNIKVLVTVIKYAPQARYFYRRKSTKGFAMSAVYMDLGGSILSLAQLVVDSKVDNDWSGITGNSAKLGLGNVGLLFSIIYLWQHHVLYRERGAKSVAIDGGAAESQPLLAESRR